MCTQHDDPLEYQGIKNIWLETPLMAAVVMRVIIRADVQYIRCVSNNKSFQNF